MAQGVRHKHARACVRTHPLRAHAALCHPRWRTSAPPPPAGTLGSTARHLAAPSPSPRRWRRRAAGRRRAGCCLGGPAGLGGRRGGRGGRAARQRRRASLGHQPACSRPASSTHPAVKHACVHARVQAPPARAKASQENACALTAAAWDVVQLWRPVHGVEGDVVRHKQLAHAVVRQPREHRGHPRAPQVAAHHRKGACAGGIHPPHVAKVQDQVLGRLGQCRDGLRARESGGRGSKRSLAHAEASSRTQGGGGGAAGGARASVTAATAARPQQRACECLMPAYVSPLLRVLAWMASSYLSNSSVPPCAAPSRSATWARAAGRGARGREGVGRRSVARCARGACGARTCNSACAARSACARRASPRQAAGQ